LPVKKLPVIYVDQSFINLDAENATFPYPEVNPFQVATSYLKSILILLSHISLYIPSMSTPTRATFHNLSILHILIILIVSGMLAPRKEGLTKFSDDNVVDDDDNNSNNLS